MALKSIREIVCCVCFFGVFFFFFPEFLSMAPNNNNLAQRLVLGKRVDKPNYSY